MSFSFYAGNSEKQTLSFVYCQHQGTRDFFMRYEIPSSVVKGEQIAIKLALFNPWMQDLEVRLPSPSLFYCIC